MQGVELGLIFLCTWKLLVGFKWRSGVICSEKIPLAVFEESV